jgi:sugar phosphate isomerase/epimerase
VSPAWPLERVIDAVAQAGSPGIGLDDYTIAHHVDAGGRVEDIAAMLRSRELVCTDVAPLLIAEDGSRAAAERFAHVTEVTGAGTCIAAVYSPIPREDVIRSLQLCADIVRESGARLALEFTSYGGLTSLSDAVDLCDAVGWERCGVLVDSLHFFRTGESWSVLRSLDGDQIALVHLDDAPPPTGDDRIHESRFGRVPPGAGSLPLEEFRDAIAATGYRGAVSAEVLSGELRALPPEEGACVLMDAVRQVWPL